MKTMFVRTACTLIALASPLWCASAALAQASVTKLVVPFPAGGGTDTLARALSIRLQTDLGDTVIVENRPGAGGNIAHDYVAAAAADGKTLLFTTPSLTINPLVDPKVRFNPQKSFAPIALLASSPILVVARPDSPFRDIPGLIRHAKANPGKMTYSSCGNGSIHQLAGEQLKALAGIHMVHIPYKGCGPAMVDLVGGQTDLAFNSLTGVAPYAKAKRVEILGVALAARSTLLPEVPTVASFGLKNYSFDGWYAVLAPAGTPEALIKRVNASLNKGLNDPEVRKALAAGSLEPVGGAPSVLADQLVKDANYYAPIIKAANITVD